MVIIDTHCHLSKRPGSGPASQLIEGMDVAKIDKAIVFGDNDFVAESAEKYPDRFGEVIDEKDRKAQVEIKCYFRGKKRK